jgi:nucleoside diphosphate kinase
MSGDPGTTVRHGESVGDADSLVEGQRTEGAGSSALEVTFNMVHGSDSDESAEREIEIWFPEG